MRNNIDILIVEDSPTQAERLKFILEKHGFRVLLAENGRQALNFLAEGRMPDIVVTDIMMPEMDGYELCKRIRADERLKSLPIILVTTLSDPADVIKGLEVGANNFITKPYDERYLVSRVRYLIANMELRKNSKAEMGINVFFSGENYFITAERLQILDLLLSTYEHAYHQNRELIATQKELRELNERLEDIVKERTAELSSAISRLKIECSERQRAEEEQVQLQTQLFQAQRIESVGRLAGGIAHDYNNMLAVILGYTQAAIEKTDPASPLHEDLREILSAAERSAGITRQLLTFARKQTLAPQVLDLNESVTAMIKILKRLVGEDINLIWLPAPKLWPVKIDPTQIDQLLANLCVNARDAIPGVGRITIETAMATFDPEVRGAEVVPGEYVILTVTDTGCGMTKEILDKIFEPFYTTKEIGHGTGLGLSTVFGIVKQHNGCINADSQPGKGTTFTIYLPRYTGEAGNTANQDNGKIQRGRGETVLVVDDEAAVLRLTRNMLKDLGYTVLTAQSSSEALKIAQDQAIRIDLLLSDVIMPEMNGRDLAKVLQTAHPGLKCLLMSGYPTTIVSIQAAVDEGVNFLQKPFSARDLAVKAREVLES